MYINTERSKTQDLEMHLYQESFRQHYKISVPDFPGVQMLYNNLILSLMNLCKISLKLIEAI